MNNNTSTTSTPPVEAHAPPVEEGDLLEDGHHNNNDNNGHGGGGGDGMDDGDIVEVPIHEDSAAADLPPVLPVHDDKPTVWYQRPVCWLLVVCLVICTIIGIVLGVTLPRQMSPSSGSAAASNSGSNVAAGDTPSSLRFPTRSPTGPRPSPPTPTTSSRGGSQPSASVPAPAPVSRQTAMKNFLIAQGISSSQDLAGVDGSPHQKALEWVTETDTLQIAIPQPNSQVSLRSPVMNDAYHLVSRYVVALIYYATDGPNSWISRNGLLNEEGHVCGWSSTNFLGSTSGVTCDSDSQVPNMIKLDFNGLRGEIPREISALWSLQVLDLEANRLNGTVPEGLADMPRLSSLFLSRNLLRGRLPDGLGKNGRLSGLVVSNNRLEGPLPSSLRDSAQSLVVLAVDDNRFTGSINEVITNGMYNLNLVFMEDNLFTGTLYGPDGTFLTNHSSLNMLDLSDNMLSGGLPARMFEMVNLDILDLHGTGLSGPLPDLALTNPRMSFLALHDNQLTGPIPTSFARRLVLLRHLDLAHNNLTGSMDVVGNMTRLSYLFLAQNDFDEGPVPESFGNLTFMRELSLKSTSRTGPIPESFAQLESLRLLDLDSNSMDGPIPAFLGNLTGLFGLLLNRNDFSGPVPAEIANLTDLEVLFLDRNSINGTMDHLCDMPQFVADQNFGHLITADCKAPVINSDQADVPPEVSCPCCTTCCSDLDDPLRCHDDYFVASIDPIWERGYTRPDFEFGNGTVLNYGPFN